MSDAQGNPVPVTQQRQVQEGSLHASEDQHIQEQHAAAEQHGGNPQGAATVVNETRPPIKKVTASKVMEAVMECMSVPVRELLMKERPLRIALVINDITIKDYAVSAIRNPVSTCCVDSLTVLNHRTVVRVEDETETTKDLSTQDDRFLVDAHAWLDRFNVREHQSFDILQGNAGFEEILQRDSVDAVYIFVPPELQQQYVLEALKARKHVLLKDPVSTPCDDFVEQMKHAVQGAYTRNALLMSQNATYFHY